MKVLITENKFKDTIKLSLKEYGTQTTIDNVGGLDNFCKVLNIESPMDFLHLFDDLDVVQSEEREEWTLFRYRKGKNLMIYNRKIKYVYFNYKEIWLVLIKKFGLKNSEIQELTQEWLDEVYNLRGVTTMASKGQFNNALDDIYNLKWYENNNNRK